MPDKASIAQPEPVSIGQILQKRREERGLTPEQAAYQSKVPLRLLQALEADDYRMLPDPGYLIRFLYDYARLLKLDPNTLLAEFRIAIRRPPRTSMAMLPSKPAPAPIPWKQVLWTAAAILMVAPLVFIALSLATKRAADRPAPPPVTERSSGEQAPADRPGLAAPEPPLSVRPEGVQVGPMVGPSGIPATSQTGSESAGMPQEFAGAASPLPQPERKLGRFLLAARAIEATWMAVRSDDGQERRVLLQKGQIVRFVADTRFVITVGNAGGVELSLNGKPIPPLGAPGQVIHDLVIPSAIKGAERPAVSSPGAAAQR